MNKNITILIPDGENELTTRVAFSIKKELGSLVTLILASADHSCFAQHSKFFSKFIPLQHSYDSTSYTAEICSVIDSEKISLLLPTTVLSNRSCIINKETIEKHCTLALLPDLEAFDATNNKWNFFQKLNAQDIRTPFSYYVSENSIFKEIDYPVIVKQIDGKNGENIFKFNTYPDEESLKTIADTGEKFLVQEFIEGYDIDCSVLCKNGKILAYTIQRPLGEEIGFVPKIERIEFKHTQEIYSLVEKMMEMFQWNGLAHVDLMYNTQKQEYVIIEINPRYWGSLLASLSVGVNFSSLHVQSSLGESFPIPEYRDEFYVNFKKYLKEFFQFGRGYGVKQTNLKYLLVDPRLMLKKVLKKFG